MKHLLAAALLALTAGTALAEEAAPHHRHQAGPMAAHEPMAHAASCSCSPRMARPAAAARPARDPSYWEKHFTTSLEAP